MAMRLFTKKEFEAHLRNHYALESTDEKTDTTHLWKTKTGYYISVPVLLAREKYPDYLLDAIEHQIMMIDGCCEKK